MNVAMIVHALGGRRVGAGWMARCPAHEDGTPSLSLRDDGAGRALVHCHAGCPQDRVLDALRVRGLWGGGGGGDAVRRAGRDRAERVEDTGLRDSAMRWWRETRAAEGTAAERYLWTRGLRLAIPTTLRFHSGLKHRTGGVWPAKVALVTRGPDDAPLGIHRTFLARDGAGKAPVEPAKMMLGPCKGGAVRLAAAGATLMIGEGIETCLAAMLATGRPAWAALSTAGLRALDLPGHVSDVIVLADGDPPGEAAARACAARWAREGRRVRIARPPAGLDFNDVLLGGAAAVAEGAP